MQDESFVTCSLSSFVFVVSVFLILESPSETSDFLLEAYDHGLMNGDFAFITVDFLLSHRSGKTMVLSPVFP